MKQESDWTFSLIFNIFIHCGGPWVCFVGKCNCVMQICSEEKLPTRGSIWEKSSTSLYHAFYKVTPQRERERELIIKILLLMISIEYELMSHDNDNCINILKNMQKYYLLHINLVNYHFNPLNLNLNFITLISFIKKYKYHLIFWHKCQFDPWTFNLIMSLDL